MTGTNVKKWEMELFGMIDRNCERDHQILIMMEHIDENVNGYHLDQMKEEEIKKEATDNYNRICEALQALGYTTK